MNDLRRCFLTLPSPSSHKHVHAHTNAQLQRASVGYASRAVPSFGLKKSWRLAVPPKYVYQAPTAVKNTQYQLPVDTPEKFEIFCSWHMPLYMLGQCPGLCMLSPDLSYREASTRTTDNIIFLRTCVRCSSPFRFADVFMCLILLQVGWFIMLIVVSVFLIGC